MKKDLKSNVKRQAEEVLLPTFTNCVLIGEKAGIHLTDENSVFILAWGDIEYLRVDFSEDQHVLQVKDCGKSDPKENVYSAIQEWVEAYQRSIL